MTGTSSIDRSPFRPVRATACVMARGIPDPATRQAVTLQVKIDPNGLRDEHLRLLVPVAMGYWACRHAGIDHPLDTTLLLIETAELNQQRLLPVSRLFQETVGSSRYATIGERIVRSRRGRFGADLGGGHDATDAFPIGFLTLPPQAAKAMQTLGSQVNFGLRNVTAMKL